MNISVCKNCEFCIDEFSFMYNLLNFENYSSFKKTIQLNNSLEKKIFDEKKDVFCHLFLNVCSLTYPYEHLVFSRNFVYDESFIKLYELGLVDYFIIRDKKTYYSLNEDLIGLIKCNDKNEFYFSKSDKILSAEERKRIIIGIKKYLEATKVHEDCPYFLEQLILKEENNVL